MGAGFECTGGAQDPPKADFGWRLNLLLDQKPAGSTKKAGDG
jgi:hypothetical protein